MKKLMMHPKTSHYRNLLQPSKNGMNEQHLGHHKLINRIKVQEDDNQPDLCAEIMNLLYHQVISLAIKIGKPINQWTKVANNLHD
jgi:hypothetical protein